MEVTQAPSHPNTTLSASDDKGAEKKLGGSQKDSKEDLAVVDDDTSEPIVDFEKWEEVRDGLVGGAGGGDDPTTAPTPKPEEIPAKQLEKESKESESASHDSVLGSNSKDAIPDWLAKQLEEEAKEEDDDDVDRFTEDEKSVLPKVTEQQNVIGGTEGGTTNSTANDRTAGAEKEPGVDVGTPGSVGGDGDKDEVEQTAMDTTDTNRTAGVEKEP